MPFNLLSFKTSNPASNINYFSFELEDVTDGEGPKILVHDGLVNGITPEGMGNDDFIHLLPINDLNDDSGAEGENDIWLEIFYQPDGSIDTVTCSVGSAKDMPESEFGKRVIQIGFALVTYDPEANVSEITQINNFVTENININLGPLERYSFQMFDASDENGPKVLISDGNIIDQDGEEWTPVDFGNDEFVLDDLNEGDFIWVEIPHDDDYAITEDPIVDSGAEVPANSDNRAYVTIGYVNINSGDINPSTGVADKVPQVIPHNNITGDINFAPPADNNNYAFQMIDKSNSDVARIMIIEGEVIDKDGVSHIAGEGGDQIFEVSSDGEEFYLQIDYDTDSNLPDAVSIATGSEVPEDTDGVKYVSIGYVNLVESAGSQTTIPHNNLCGNYEFNVDSLEVGDAEDDTSYVDDISKISFKLGTSEDGSLVADNGDGEVIVYLQIPKPSDTGTFVLGVVDGKIQWLETDSCSSPAQ